jgi:hypothetical protein
MHLYPILLQYVINGLMVLSEVVTVPRESNHIRIGRGCEEFGWLHSGTLSR